MLVSATTTVVLLLMSVSSNWVMKGGLLGLLNGVTQEQLAAHVHPPGVDIQTGNLTAQDMLRLAMAPLRAGGARRHRAEVVFPRAFSRPPRVILGITSLETGRAADTRVSLEVEHAIETGFVYTVTTWEDSVVRSVGASWTAFVEPAQAD